MPGYPPPSIGPRVVQAPPPGAEYSPNQSAGTAGQRPIGIMVIAVLATIGAAIGLLTGFQYLQYADYFGVSSDTVRGIGLIIVLVSLAWIAVAWGLWKVRSWAWMAAGGVAGLSLGLQVLALVSGGGGDAIGALIQIVTNGAILYYLSTPVVRATFGRPSRLGSQGH